MGTGFLFRARECLTLGGDNPNAVKPNRRIAPLVWVDCMARRLYPDTFDCHRHVCKPSRDSWASRALPSFGDKLETGPMGCLKWSGEGTLPAVQQPAGRWQ